MKSFEILEYCDPDKAIEREQYYLDQLRPKYNILKTAGSSLGFKHSAETIAKLKGRKHSEEAIAKMREKALTPERLEQLKRLNADLEFRAKNLEQLKRLHANPEYQAKRLEQLNRIHSQMSIQILVLDTKTNETSSYPSISETARAIGVAQSSISGAFKRKPGESTVLIKKKRYQITKLLKSS